MSFKKSIQSLVLFLGIVLVLVVGLDIFLDRQMKALQYDDASVWNQIAKGGIDADVLIMGSSRAATHIDPLQIEQQTGLSCYNLGMMGHNFLIEDARYRFYLQFNKAPKLIILSLDYESLQKRVDLFNHTQFLAYLDDSIIAQVCRQYEGFSKYDYYLPLLKYAGEQVLIKDLLLNYFSPARNKPDRIKGFFGREFSWNASVDQALDTLTPYVVRPDTPSVKAFENFILQCKAQQIRLAFVHTPTHPLGQAKVINRQTIINIYKDYALQFNIPFLDYAQDNICAQKQYFMNATHLNKKGALLFTQMFIRDLQDQAILPIILPNN